MTVFSSGQSGVRPTTSLRKTKGVTEASGIPSPPKNVAVTGLSNTSIQVTWDAPDINAGAEYLVTLEPSAGSIAYSGNSATVTGLSRATSYEVSVSSQNTKGRGSKSSNSGSTLSINEATGGTVTTVSNYNGTGQTWKVHTFTSGGTFVVTDAPNTFRLLIVGGGGSGGTGVPNGSGGGGGGGGVYWNSSYAAGIGSYTVTVGGGAFSNADYHPSGPNGGTSSFDSLTAGGGGGGGTGRWDGKKPVGGGAAGTVGTVASGGNGASGANDRDNVGGGQGGEPAHAVTGGFTNNVTGASVIYAVGGGGGNGYSSGITTSSPGSGGGASPPAFSPTAQGGMNGVVVIAYQIQ